MALHIEDYAFITEFLCGGYTYKGAGVRQCSKKVQLLFKQNNYVKLIEYRDYLVANNFILPQWVRAINESSALRYFIIGSLHDAVINNIVYNGESKCLEMELSPCLHDLLLCGEDAEKQKILIIFKGIANGKNILSKCVFSKEEMCTLIQHRLDVDDKINLKVQIRTYGKLDCREAWLNLSCDEIFFVEKL